jgi:adenylate cyclase
LIDLGSTRTETLAVGFVDLVGSTPLIERLDEAGLLRFVERWERLVHSTVTDGGRVVKMLGDEVMFTADDPATAASIALALLAAVAWDDVLPPGRAGSDCHGSVVNLASRICHATPRGAVAVSDPLRLALDAEDDLTFVAMGDRALKGVGRVPVWLVREQPRPALV